MERVEVSRANIAVNQDVITSDHRLFAHKVLRLTKVLISGITRILSLLLKDRSLVNHFHEAVVPQIVLFELDLGSIIALFVRRLLKVCLEVVHRLGAFLFHRIRFTRYYSCGVFLLKVVWNFIFDFKSNFAQF